MLRVATLVALFVPFPCAWAFQAPASGGLAEARAALSAARFTQAADLFAAVIAQEPANAEAYYGVVRALLGARRPQEAYTYAEQGLQRAPQNAETEDAAGIALVRKGELVKAEAHFRAALKLRGNDPAALQGMASIFSVISKNKTARALTLQAYAQAPNDPSLMQAHAYTLKGADRIQALERVLALLDPASEEARNLHARIAVEKAAAGRELGRLITPYESTRVKMFWIMDGLNKRRGVHLRVQFNQRQTLRLLLDTGASGISIAPKAAEKAGLQALGGEGRDAKGIGDDKAGTAFEYLAAEVRIGDVAFADYPIAVFKGAQSADFDGLIGADVFRQFVIGVDFSGLELTLDARPGLLSDQNEPADAADTVPKGFFRVLRFGNHMALPASANGEPPVIFLIDSGATNNLIDVAIARKASKIYKDDRTTVRGVQGKVTEVNRANDISLAFAGFRQSNPDLIAIDLTKMSDDMGVGFAGILGMPVLSQMKLTIDYREGVIRMEPQPQPLPR
jgi:tetratricopeptide (TPR) repeat protein